MKWFAGSINEAVATSKSRKAVFVVFIEGENETSAQFAQTINSPEVSERLEKDDFVAIKIKSESEAHGFFVQIYHLVPVPSLFFIGENGIPLEIIADVTTVDDLILKINNVLIWARKNDKHSSLNLINVEQKAVATSSGNNDNVTEAAESNINDIQSKDIDVASNVSITATASSSCNEEDVTNSANATTSVNSDIKDNNEVQKKDTEIRLEPLNETMPSLDERIARAKELQKLCTKKRMEEEQEEELKREIERRRIGHDVQKMRQMQHELEVKLACEERMREKAAEAAAREKVRQQIAQDKLERKQKELALKEQLQQQQQQCQEQPKPKISSIVSNATVTRIQFRLPSGNAHTGQFEPSSTLGNLRTYVVENIELPFQQFSMSTSFPMRLLTNEEDNKTLLELELVPSAVILILPVKNSGSTKTLSSAQNAGFLYRYLWYPLYTLISYLFGTNRSITNQRNNSDNQATEATTSNVDRGTSQNWSQRPLSSETGRRYYGAPRETTVIRARRNIYRLHSDDDDNDENNTWNGNSTQQM